MKQLFLGCATLCGCIIMMLVTGKVIDLVVSHETIALLSGAMVGILIAAPCASICTVIWMKRKPASPPPPPQVMTATDWEVVYTELRMMELRDVRNRQLMLDESPREPTQLARGRRQ